MRSASIEVSIVTHGNFWSSEKFERPATINFPTCCSIPGQPYPFEKARIKESLTLSTKTVLSVGQCRPDSAAIAHYLKTHFKANVLTADLPDQALAVLNENPVDLVLLNRQLDIDSSDGLAILALIRASSKPDVPVMLVSNYADWQQKAVELGAVYGFGKAELNKPETRDRLASILSND